MEITRGKIPCAKKTVIYGPEGIGKSTFASKFPDPIFIDTEGSTRDMDVGRLPAPTSWNMLLEEVKYVIQNPSVCKTLVIDTADWAEQLCSAGICDKYQKTGIEDFGYGKGYVFLQEEFGRLLNLLSELAEQKGIHVVLTAHAKMRKFEQPDEMGAYDRWEMKLSKNVSPMVKEWADMVLFANYKTHVIKVDGKNKAQGGQRVMYTTHHSCWDAKNRYGLPDEVPFTYDAIAHVLGPSGGTQTKVENTPPDASNHPDASAAQPAEETSQPVSDSYASVTEPRQMEMSFSQPEDDSSTSDLDPRIPKNLRDLMAANQVCEWDIQNVVEARGYVPSGTPIWEYDTVNPGIVDGLLVASWAQVYAAIKEMKEKQEIPFN